ncbi:unnamed protein product [Tuber melanosporum]|uniref:(Perigord truffle) hypothetical protein n=1 Tax=Tuber melanosporum (strain Mel28) TaxID=656061 RepID=D5GEB2_TUBMM|nr:uncharacterized protein GSTUM_00001251001 [Tuber melanosporum]CAZ82855.1 unnamed protein product [Tuber melanosporum]
MVSPTTLPQSFGALRDSVNTLGMRVRNSPGTSPSFGSTPPTGVFERLSGPVPNARQASEGSSLHKAVEEPAPGESRSSTRRHHRRRATSQGGLKAREAQAEDMMFPATMENLHHCDEKHCSNHHHRQSSSSTISIKCDKSDEDEASAIERLANGETGATIHMDPYALQMLVPLVDRPQEMRELLERGSNKAWASLVRRTFGEKLYKAQCLPLWTETDRWTMPDREWLRRTKDLLMRKACGGCTDGRLWSGFCAMVGWDESEIEMEEGRAKNGRSHCSGARSRSHDSSPQMNAILEVEDEDGRKYY